MQITKRNITIDLIRIFAAFGVIAIHVPYSTSSAELISRFFFPFCVPFFYVVSLTYFYLSLKSATINEIFSRIWWKIAVPYLVWTATYILLIVIKRKMSGQAIELSYWRMIFYGDSAVHLYFLPQLIAMQMILLSIFLFKSWSNKNLLIAVSLLTGVTVYLLIGYAYSPFGTTSPPSIVVYILSALCLSYLINYKRASGIFLILGCLIVLITILKEFLDISFFLIPVIRTLPIGGVGLMLIAISTPIYRLPKALFVLSTTTFGIYLCHVIFLEAFEFLQPRIWSGGLIYTFLVKILICLLIFILSTMFVLFVSKFNFLRQPLLGIKKWNKHLPNL